LAVAKDRLCSDLNRELAVSSFWCHGAIFSAHPVGFMLLVGHTYIRGVHCISQTNDT